jgi:hypothetical protein
MPRLDELTLTEIARKDLLERLLFLASKPKRRADLIKAIHTSEFINPLAIIPLGTGEISVERVLGQLRSIGCDTECYVISGLRNLDGKVLPLSDAISSVLGNTVETVLFCEKSKTGFYEGGHSKDRYILKGTSHK